MKNTSKIITKLLPMRNRRFNCLTISLITAMWLMTFFSMAQSPSNQNLEITGIKALPYLLEKNNVEFQPILVKANLTADSCLAIAYIY